jgi:hypothetical protein
MSRKTGYVTDDLKFVSTGLCPNCVDCSDNFGYDSMEKFNQDCENGEVYDEGSFSWDPCDECNTSLGGNSYYAHGVDENDDIIHFAVCQDCLMELNGYEVEQ